MKVSENRFERSIEEILQTAESVERREDEVARRAGAKLKEEITKSRKGDHEDEERSTRN